MCHDISLQYILTISQAICATGLTVGLRRIPAGFHVAVHADGADWQTSNKPAHLDQHVIEWNERILLPSEPSAKVRVRVYASFELDPMLDDGELLRAVETSVGDLLHRCEKSHPVIFQPKAEEVLSPFHPIAPMLDIVVSHDTTGRRTAGISSNASSTSNVPLPSASLIINVTLQHYCSPSSNWWSCDAIIILHKQPPARVRLLTDLKRLARSVLALRENIDKEAGPRKTQAGLMNTLREPWDDVVRPVVEKLDRFVPQGSRLWWCPTSYFNFLPLHAAGEYKRNGKSLSQLYVSSYTPSLTAPIGARKSNDRSLSVSFAAIGQNHPPGHSLPLEAVEPELELVRRLIPPTISFTKVTSAESTRSRTLQALQDNRWLHLRVTEHKTYIIQTDLSRHEFAFLSACGTALGDFETPDEVIHLAAALQFAGVKSTTGTFWTVDDMTARRLVEAFYTNLCGDGKMNSKQAARALHKAVQSLACDTDMPLDQRIVFMHIGL
ncbi:CHAT domain-containing protein [Suillus clintonianus]|uniref:CHAT domain-containing protein n=1 Tax=Suillus clintonianus TaxID=1904413 RepID=UPI001B863AF8|nr:CHAT domain-containing protein [Suillus clintonianus]KAG2117705.1 CHAT domain-containing protein [Suillus clintonianus]